MSILFTLIVVLASSALAQTEVRVDGSSTVYPVSLGIAEEFQIFNPSARVTVAFSGTGAGFEKFCRGETEATGASRPIKQSEIDLCAENGIEFVEVPMAADGLSVVVNPANDWAQCLSVEQLSMIWEPGSDVQTWADVDPSWPDDEIVLYGAGTDSGTFDYFTEAINGESGAIRTDFFPSEDDNVLVQGVAGDRYALGYFGYAYYAENQDRLELLAVDGGSGCITPSPETIDDQSYTPLSRPLYVYVKTSALQRPEVAAYVRFMMNNAADLVPATGYIPLSGELYQENLDAVEAASPAPQS